jgi:hypothetical protein
MEIYALNGEAIGFNESKQLQSKGSSGKVGGINDKPSVDAEGLYRQNSDLVKSATEQNVKLSIAETPDLYKQNGVSMSKIPFTFTAVPNYFFESGWFKNEKTFKFVIWAFSKCRPHASNIIFDNKKIILLPFEFICGRNKGSCECFLTPQEFRNQVKTMLNAGLLKKSTNSSTNRFNAYIWVTSEFSEKTNQVSNQQATNSQPTPNHKQELRSNIKENNNNEGSVCVFPEKIYECIKHESELSEDEKIELSKFEEDVVVNAYAVVSSYGKIETTFFIAMKSACKNKFKPRRKSKSEEQARLNWMIKDLFFFAEARIEGNFVMLACGKRIDPNQSDEDLRKLADEIWERSINGPESTKKE